MTSNERKIINFLRDAKEKAHIRLIAKKTNFSSDYTQSLCHSLARAGYVKLENSNVCHLLKKGQGHFESVAVMREVSEPMVVTANVTLPEAEQARYGAGLTDEPAVASPASDQSDEEEGQEEGASEENDKDKSESGDEALDKALADLEPSFKKEEGEKIDEPEEPEKTESAEEAEVKEEQKKEEEILAEPAIKEEKTESSDAATEPKEEVKIEAQETGATETKPADNPAPAAPLESPEETAAINKEEKQEKEDAVKPSSGSGWSFKKIVNWFTEKK